MRAAGSVAGGGDPCLGPDPGLERGLAVGGVCQHPPRIGGADSLHRCRTGVGGWIVRARTSGKPARRRRRQDKTARRRAQTNSGSTLVVYLSVDVHRNDVGGWCAHAQAAGIGPADGDDPAPLDDQDLAPEHLDAPTVVELVDTVRAYCEALSDDLNLGVSALYSLEGDPTAWAALVADHGLDQRAELPRLRSTALRRSRGCR